MKLNILSVLLPLGLWFAPHTVAAQSSSPSKAASSQLFDDAEALMAKGEVAQACTRYAESERLDPQLGTLLHLGDCYDKEGKTASAWVSFKDAAELAAQRHDDREAPARARLAELEPRLSKLTIEVSAEAPPGLEIEQDGESIGRATLGSPFPIDPGEHKIVARARGYEDWSQSVIVSNAASTVRVIVPGLRSLPPHPAVAAPATYVSAPSPLASRSTAQANLDSPVRDAGASQRVLGYVIGGAGIVGIGVGTAFALAMKSKMSDRDDANACSNTSACTFDNKIRIDQLTSEARTFATVANVGFIAGGIALVGGLALVVTGFPKDNRTGLAMQFQPLIGSNSLGVGAGGRW